MFESSSWNGKGKISTSPSLHGHFPFGGAAGVRALPHNCKNASARELKLWRIGTRFRAAREGEIYGKGAGKRGEGAAESSAGENGEMPNGIRCGRRGKDNLRLWEQNV